MSKSKYNFLQPIYLDYNEQLVESITGYVMPFPELGKFNEYYGRPQDRAPVASLRAAIRLLLPQIRAIDHKTIVNGQPNPAVFLAARPVRPDILALIFRSWIKVWYPDTKQRQELMSLCSEEKCEETFRWMEATPEQVEYWAPSWAIAFELSKHEYKWGEKPFKFLFGPGYYRNQVELVSWPPFGSSEAPRASIALTVSTQSDLDSTKKINLHFSMKRWLVKQGSKPEVRLEKNATRCYVRRLRPWLGGDDAIAPPSFTVVEAKYGRKDGAYVPQWKDKQLREILELLSVKLPAIADVLANPSHFIETKQTDILIPARSYQKLDWGTGFPFSNRRDLLGQIKGALPPDVVLPAPWKKMHSIQELRKSSDWRFQQTPEIPRESQDQLPELGSEIQEFLAGRANNLEIRVFCLTGEVQMALERVAKHYFGNRLTLKFQQLQGLADPIDYRESRLGKREANLERFQQFEGQNRPEVPTPAIVEIWPEDYPAYRNQKDPKPYLKHYLPQYNLIPQCIVSLGKGKAKWTNLRNRALSAILDAILPLSRDYPLSICENGLYRDSSVYAGFYVIHRNKKTANQAFQEPVLVAIHKNQVSVLLPAKDLQFRSMADAICELSRNRGTKMKRGAKVDTKPVVDNMLCQLIQHYSTADNIYLFVHAQEARQYWPWIQDSEFDPANPPSDKIHVMRIRDQSRYEVPQTYGLSTEQEIFDEDAASFAEHIFVPEGYVSGETHFTQTVLSISKKPLTSKKLSRKMSRSRDWISDRGVERSPSTREYWKTPQARAHNILATPSPEKFELHHAIAHDLRSRHWWTKEECKYPVPLSLAEKLKEWCFSKSNESEDDEN